VASLFLVLATRQLVLLRDIELAKSFKDFGSDALMHLTRKDNIPTRITYASLWTNLAPLIGLVVALIISLTLTTRWRLFWVNALIGFILGLILNRLGIFNYKIVNEILYYPGELTTQFGIQYEFIMNGVILTLIGLFIFFNKWTKNHILDYQTNKADNISTEE
jgi:MFS family permease